MSLYVKIEMYKKNLPEEFLSIPETYWKYVRSLNQDQLETASTDASTPLMVMAEPGSGKLSFSLHHFAFVVFSCS